MEKTFKDLLSNLRDLFAEEKVAMGPASRILAKLNERRREVEETHDEERDIIEFPCKHFLNGRIPKTISQS